MAAGGGMFHSAHKPILNADDLNEDMDSKNKRFEEIKRQ